MAFTLRDYQREAVEAVFEYLQRGGRAPLVEVPTGGGKSAILGEIVRRVVGEHGGRVLVATHRKELLEQDERAILNVWPDGRRKVGVYSAGLGRREIRACTVGGVQSLAKRARELGHVDVVIVDEAHLVNTADGTQYAKLLGGLEEVNPDQVRIGLTATPYRMDQGLLTQGEGALFKSIVYRAEIKRLIAEGFLSPLVTQRGSKAINLDDVRTRMGDYVVADLELAADIDEITDAVAADIAASGRQHVLAFGVSVEHAHRLRNAIQFAGLSCEVVVGETPNRAAILERFKRGDLQAIASCDVLTTGFDAPLVDCVALVRPTQSPALYVQMVGRGSRICAGKLDCLVLDYGGNIARHGPIDEIEIRPKLGNGNGSAPIKVCFQCGAENPAGVRFCTECDSEFPPPERKASETASRLDVVSRDDGPAPEPVRRVVERTEYSEHVSKSGNLTFRVDHYGPGSRTEWDPVVSEYVCLDHTNYARTKAESWWLKRCPDTQPPDSVAEAMTLIDKIKPVRAIYLVPDGKFQRVSDVEFGEPEAREPGSDDDIGNWDCAHDQPEPDGFFDDDLPF
jgi:DNA repair protein RadD